MIARLVERPDCLPQDAPCGLKIKAGVGEPVLHRLEGADRLVKLHTPLGILHSHLESGACGSLSSGAPKQRSAVEHLAEIRRDVPNAAE